MMYSYVNKGVSVTITWGRGGELYLKNHSMFVIGINATAVQAGSQYVHEPLYFYRGGGPSL